jgi:hypothetical protein
LGRPASRSASPGGSGSRTSSAAPASLPSRKVQVVEAHAHAPHYLHWGALEELGADAALVACYQAVRVQEGRAELAWALVEVGRVEQFRLGGQELERFLVEELGHHDLLGLLAHPAPSANERAPVA